MNPNVKGGRGRQPASIYENTLSSDDADLFYKPTEVIKAEARMNFRTPEELSQMFPVLGQMYRREPRDSLGILAPLRPTFRGLERMTFNVGYACLGGFALGSLMGFGRVLPHSRTSLQMGDPLWLVTKRTFRVAREEGANGLRRWGSIVTLHSLVEAVARYALWNMVHQDDLPPEPVMVTDDMSPQQVMQLSIKEPARRVVTNYDLRSMNGGASPLRYPFHQKLLSSAVEDPRVIPVWTAIPLMLTRAYILRNSAPKWSLAASVVAYPAAVYLWQSRMPPDTYMDLHEEFVPDESMQPMM